MLSVVEFIYDGLCDLSSNITDILFNLIGCTVVDDEQL